MDMFVLPGATLISKDAFDAVGGFDERLTGYEDDDLFIRIFCAGYIGVYVNRVLTAWRILTNIKALPDLRHKHRANLRERLCEQRVRADHNLIDLLFGKTKRGGPAIDVAPAHRGECQKSESRPPLRKLNCGQGFRI